MKSTDLTDEQFKFAKTRDKHMIVLAAAGAGKTGSCVSFIADKMDYGVKADEIVAFSFTKKAANELKDRITKEFEKQNYDFKYVSTIHSFCWNELIKPFYKEIGYTNIPSIIYDFPEEFMEEEYKKFGKKKEKGAFNKGFYQLVSKDLHNGSFEKVESGRLLEYLVTNNLVMFDYMIHLANFVLEDEDCFERVHSIFKNIKYIITDEAQDLNDAQYVFLKNLRNVTDLNTKTNLVLVGDVKQGIYGFRGSRPELMNVFIDEFNPSVEILSFNFRSSPEIVELANDIASTIDLGKHDAMIDSKISKAANTDLVGDVYNITDVEEFIDELKLFEKPLHDTCILARTNQAIKSLAKILGRLEIPYYLHTEYDILKRAEVKLFMQLLSLVSNGYNKSLALDVIRSIKGGVPLKISSGISKCSSMYDIGNMFSDVKKIPELIQIFKSLEFNQFGSAIPQISKLLENPKKTAMQMEQSLNRFYRDLNDVKVREGLNNWMEALEEMLFEAQFLEEKSSHKIQLMTVHKSKGLQWDNVLFIYDFSLLEQVENNFYDLEEEKRVVYTAVTRPKRNLAIWDLPQNEMSDLLYKGGLERKIEKGLARGLIDISDFSKFSKGS